MVELSPETILCFLNANGPTPLKEIEKHFAPDRRHQVGAMLFHLMDADRAVEETATNVFQITDRGKQVLDDLRVERERAARQPKVKQQGALFA